MWRLFTLAVIVSLAYLASQQFPATTDRVLEQLDGWQSAAREHLPWPAEPTSSAAEVETVSLPRSRPEPQDQGSEAIEAALPDTQRAAPTDAKVQSTASHARSSSSTAEQGAERAQPSVGAASAANATQELNNSRDLRGQVRSHEAPPLNSATPSEVSASTANAGSSRSRHVEAEARREALMALAERMEARAFGLER